MIIHPTKTKEMIIATQQKHQLCPLKINLQLKSTSKPIQQVTSHKLLRDIIDEKLSLNEQITNICRKVSKNIYLLRKLAMLADKKSLLLFAHAHIISHINYVSSLWDCASKSNLKQLNFFHHRVAKTISKDHSSTTDDKLIELNILSLEKKCCYNKAVLMFKIFHNNTPSYLISELSLSTRKNNSKNFILPNCRIDICKARISFAGAATWNNIPLIIKNSHPLSSFKRNYIISYYKAHTLHLIYYTYD